MIMILMTLIIQLVNPSESLNQSVTQSVSHRFFQILALLVPLGQRTVTSKSVFVIKFLAGTEALSDKIFLNDRKGDQTFG